MKQTIKLDATAKACVMLNDKDLADDHAITKEVNALVAKAVAENKPETFAWYGYAEALNELNDVHHACVLYSSREEDRFGDVVRGLLMIYRLGIPYMLARDHGITFDYDDYHNIHVHFWSEVITTDSDVRDEIARLQARITELQASLTN